MELSPVSALNFLTLYWTLSLSPHLLSPGKLVVQIFGMVSELPREDWPEEKNIFNKNKDVVDVPRERFI